MIEKKILAQIFLCETAIGSNNQKWRKRITVTFRVRKIRSYSSIKSRSFLKHNIAPKAMPFYARKNMSVGGDIDPLKEDNQVQRGSLSKTRNKIRLQTKIQTRGGILWQPRRGKALFEMIDTRKPSWKRASWSHFWRASKIQKTRWGSSFPMTSPQGHEFGVRQKRKRWAICIIFKRKKQPRRRTDNLVCFVFFGKKLAFNFSFFFRKPLKFHHSSLRDPGGGRQADLQTWEKNKSKKNFRCWLLLIFECQELKVY